MYLSRRHIEVAKGVRPACAEFAVGAGGGCPTRQDVRQRHAQARTDHLLGGLLECVCGRKVRSDGTFSDGRHRKLHPDPCDAWGDKARLADATWEPAVLQELASIRLDDATIAGVVTTLASRKRPVAIERGRVDRQLRELALDHAAGNLNDEAYLTQSAALRSQRDALTAEETPTVSAECAVEWLRAIGDPVRLADLPAERSDLVHAVYERIVVAGPTFVSAGLTPAA